ncbi:MAG: DPP IV N-terminal domain-containing protein [Planctomycetes bacterium]|nr:DPP IV N-terminal domain-containing protein [Planctomycetota bacterium]
MRHAATILLILNLSGCAMFKKDVVSSRAPNKPNTLADTPAEGSSAAQGDTSFLEQYALTRRFSAGRPRTIKIVPDGSAVLFLRSGPRSRIHDLYEFDVSTGEERVLLTADQILQGAAEELSVEERARRERMRLSARGIAMYALSKDGAQILVPLSGRLFVIQRATGDVKELKSDKGFPLDARFSPDGRFVSCVRGGELYVTTIETAEERRLTVGANDEVTHGLSEFVAQEEMGRRQGYWWSPDSKTLVYQRTSTEGLETMYIADAMHPERKPQSWPYPRPGMKNAEVTLGLFSVDGRAPAEGDLPAESDLPAVGSETRWITWDAKRYPYLATVRWSENAPLTILVQNREQTEEALLTVDTDTGSTSILLVEKDDAWLNLVQVMPKWFPDGSAFLWATERKGAWQLEKRARDGHLIATLTTTAFNFRGVIDLDVDNGVVYVRGGDDPTQVHLYTVALNGAPATPLRITSEPGMHSATFSKNHEVFLHSSSTLDGAWSQIVRGRDGRRLGRLRSVAEEPPFLPEIELTTVGRKPYFHAVLIRPRNFDASKKYPVIVSVYGGPHAQTVRASSRSYLMQQWMADHGFIVVSIDGRGTPARGRTWERAIKGNLIDVPLDDQVAGLRALGEKYPEMDLNHVGIYGWSFGGYFSAMAVMRRGDVFDVGVAGAPVCDWRDYDTHYTERYMGLPEKNPTGYEKASVLTYCGDLEKPLLIIHGTADDNVYFMHSLKMSNALFRAGKEHDFLALSDFTHMVADPLITKRLYGRIMKYLSQHLLVPKR